MNEIQKFLEKNKDKVHAICKTQEEYLGAIESAPKDSIVAWDESGCIYVHQNKESDISGDKHE